MNTKAGIEGVPLQLMLAAIVAAVALGVILSWSDTISSPKVINEITYNPDVLNVYADSNNNVAKPETTLVEVTVKDSDGNPVASAVVSFSGMGVRETGTTDDAGKCTIDVSSAELAAGHMTGNIDVKAEKSDYKSKTSEYILMRTDKTT